MNPDIPTTNQPTKAHTASHEIQPNLIGRLRILEALKDNEDLNGRRRGTKGYNKFTSSYFRYGWNHVSPPSRLYAVGPCSILNSERAVSFGGTCSPSTDGFQLAELLAQIAVRESRAIIIGGGVTGIDMAAHLGALDVSGCTVAVLANPVEYGIHPYAPRRAFLEEGILTKGGLLLSEYSDWMDDRSQRLLERDRIITALADIFIAIECSSNSGTVDAAKRAWIQGKKVFAIDWRQFERTWGEPEMSGCDQMIMEGIADPLPKIRVGNFTDAIIATEFVEALRAVSPPHVILYRPVGPKELALIRDSGMKTFPPRLPEQPIFYPVLNEEYAVQIARDWNVSDSGSGYVTRFAVRSDYLAEFKVETVGGSIHQELWVPAEKLEEFNRNIVGLIEVIAEFTSKQV